MSDIWSWTNWLDDPGTLLRSSGTIGGFPAYNLQDPRVGKVWRRASAAEEPHVEFTLGVARPIAVIGAFGGDMQPGGRFRLRLSTMSSGEYEALDVLLAPEIHEHRRQWIWRPEATPVLARRIRIDPVDSLEIGRLWAGPADWTPQVGHIIGSGFSVVDYGQKQIAPVSGAIITAPAAKRRMFTPRYDSITTDEALGPVTDMDLIAGSTGQVLFVPDAEVYEPNLAAVLGSITALNPIVAAGWQRGAREYSILETG